MSGGLGHLEKCNFIEIFAREDHFSASAHSLPRAPQGPVAARRVRPFNRVSMRVGAFRDTVQDADEALHPSHQRASYELMTGRTSDAAAAAARAGGSVWKPKSDLPVRIFR